MAPAEGASFSPPVLVKPPIFQDAPYWVAPITTAPVNKTITATVQWGMPHSGLVCAMVYPGFKSSPAGVTGTVVSRTLTATTVTLTAAKPGTYKVTYGYDSCHMSPALTVRFV
ncbi:MAG: hypothetical protein LBR33_06220 [Propionibacteriaceae bacterium]|nr:hypothetical protein [Propionibacteriaceae bacterium]